MKMDIDSILYIVISLIILIVSGLSSARRKKAREQQQAGQAPSPEAETDDLDSSPAYTASEDAFTRLEQFLTGQSQTFPMEEEVPEAVRQEEAPDPRSSETTEARVVSLEGESLESIVDEEEAYLAEKKAAAENLGPTIDDTTIGAQEAEDAEAPYADHELISGLTGLFNNPDEIRRAVIYTEIFRRKY